MTPTLREQVAGLLDAYWIRVRPGLSPAQRDLLDDLCTLLLWMDDASPPVLPDHETLRERFISVLRKQFWWSELSGGDAVKLADQLCDQLPPAGSSVPPTSSIPTWCPHLRYDYSHKQQKSVWFFTEPGQQPQAIAETWTRCPICPDALRPSQER